MDDNQNSREQNANIAGYGTKNFATKMEQILYENWQECESEIELWKLACIFSAKDGVCEGCDGAYTEWCDDSTVECAYYYYELAKCKSRWNELARKEKKND